MVIAQADDGLMGIKRQIAMVAGCAIKFFGIPVEDVNVPRPGFKIPPLGPMLRSGKAVPELVGARDDLIVP